MTRLKMLLFQYGLDDFWGILHRCPKSCVAMALILIITTLGYVGAYFFVWSLAIVALLWGLGAPHLVWEVTGVILLVFNVPWIRQWLISWPVMSFLKAMKFLPTISETERVAIESGNVWVDAELFSGKPNFRRLMKESYPELTPDEQAFLDGPCETLCKMVDDWNVYQRRDFSQEI